jgi:hypothetical protein
MSERQYIVVIPQGDAVPIDMAATTAAASATAAVSRGNYIALAVGLMLVIAAIGLWVGLSGAGH